MKSSYPPLDEYIEWLPDIPEPGHNPAKEFSVIENQKRVIFGVVKRFGKAVPSIHWHK